MGAVAGLGTVQTQDWNRGQLVVTDSHILLGHLSISAGVHTPNGSLGPLSAPKFYSVPPCPQQALSSRLRILPPLDFFLENRDQRHAQQAEYAVMLAFISLDKHGRSTCHVPGPVRSDLQIFTHFSGSSK